jgi:hypothetical protein
MSCHAERSSAFTSRKLLWAAALHRQAVTLQQDAAAAFVRFVSAVSSGCSTPMGAWATPPHARVHGAPARACTAALQLS